MSLRRLDISGLRNLRKVSLKGCMRINILSGANGSGKTSLLEAIYLMGMGRSFRSSRLTPLISHDLNECILYGELESGHPQGYQSLGLMRTRRGEQEFRVNQAPAASAAELASVLPVQIINSDSFVLLDGGPQVRRQLMDWGVFHVKPTFLDLWRRAQRSLKQRNSLLRRHDKGGRDRITLADLLPWDKELAESARDIDALRAQYLEDMLPIFDEVLQRLVEIPGLTVEYKRGWSPEKDLLSALEESFQRDARLGATTVGPHRANLDIRIKGLPASEVLSRGQQKLVVSALRLAQGRCLALQTGVHCIYLVDDLPAELDRNHRITLCELLDEMKSQVFMTSVDADIIEDRWQDRSAIQRFHVKQGEIFCN